MKRPEATIALGNPQEKCRNCQLVGVGRRRRMGRVVYPPSVERAIEDSPYRVNIIFPLCTQCQIALRRSDFKDLKTEFAASFEADILKSLAALKAKWEKKTTVTPKVLADILKVMERTA